MSSGPFTPRSPASPLNSGRSLLSVVGGGERITAENVAHMFAALTGKESTPEELASVQRKLDEAYARLAAPQYGDTSELAQSIARDEVTSTWPFTYYDHENNYFRLSDFHAPAVRRGGKWELYRGLYMRIDIRTYGVVVTRDEAESI